MGNDVICLRGLNSEKEREVFNGFRNEEVIGVLVESSVDDVGWIWVYRSNMWINHPSLLQGLLTVQNGHCD